MRHNLSFWVNRCLAQTNRGMTFVKYDQSLHDGKFLIVSLVHFHRTDSFRFFFLNLPRWSFLLRPDWLWPLPMSVVAAGSLMLMALGVFHNLVKSQQPVGQIPFKFKLILVFLRGHILMQARILSLTYLILNIKIFWNPYQDAFVGSDEGEVSSACKLSEQDDGFLVMEHGLDACGTIMEYDADAETINFTVSSIKKWFNTWKVKKKI